MSRKLPVFLLIAVASAGNLLAKPKKPSLPEQFEHARTVFVEARYGDITDLKLDRDERDAILDVQDGVNDWGRYALANSRIDADLILVVYRGQYYHERTFPSTVQSPGIGAGHSPIQNPADASQGSTTDPNGTGREKDELRVYTLGQDGKLKGPLWRSQMDNGLLAPNLFLLQQLKYEVEKAYPNTPAKQPNTP
jgi:hypothetical protein